MTIFRLDYTYVTNPNIHCALDFFLAILHPPSTIEMMLSHAMMFCGSVDTCRLIS